MFVCFVKARGRFASYCFSLLSLSLGVFSLGVPVDHLFFIGNQLVATSHTGKVGVWNAVTQHWQVGLHRVCVSGWIEREGERERDGNRA